MEGHGLGLDAAGKVPGSSLRVGNSGRSQEPAVDRVAPHNRVPRLIVEVLRDRLVTLGIDGAFQAAPLRRERRRFRRALIVAVVDVLNDRLPRVQDV